MSQAQIEYSVEWVAEMLRLPAHVMIVGATYDAQRRCVAFVVHSDKLPENQEGVPVPIVERGTLDVNR